MQKQKFPYRDAMNVATGLKDWIAQFCDRIEIAGSLRRKRDFVSDIEILYIPKIGSRMKDLLATELYSIVDPELEKLIKNNILAKRPNKNGILAWGEKNKLGVHVASGIPVDFFSTTEACWWNSLVCRTGGKENNLTITKRAIARGYSFEAYGSGFKSLRSFEHHQTTSEKDVFDFIGLPYLEPEKRQ